MSSASESGLDAGEAPVCPCELVRAAKVWEMNPEVEEEGSWLVLVESSMMTEESKASVSNMEVFIGSSPSTDMSCFRCGEGGRGC